MIEESESVRVAVVYHEDGCAGLSQVRDAADLFDTDDEPMLGWCVTPIQAQPFSPPNLAKLSRGLRYGTQLAVIGGKAPRLRIDGIARRKRFANGGNVTRIAAPRPGVLVFEYQYQELFRFEAGRRAPDAIDMFSTKNPVRAAVGKITRDGSDRQDSWSFTEHAIDSILRGMRQTGAGGILALSPSEPDPATLAAVRYRWLDTGALARAIVGERKKRLGAIFAGHVGSKRRATKKRLRELRQRQQDAREARDALDAVIDDIAQLSAIDGAVLAGPGLDVYGGGYMVPGQKPAPPARRANDVAGRKLVAIDPHGARHGAAINFAYLNPGGVAFVVSEDGPAKAALRINNKVVVWPVRISET